MSELSKSSYQEYRETDSGDTVVLTAQNPESGQKYDYKGTVFESIGATVRIQATDGRMIELRSVEENDTGDMAVLLAIDGKEVGDTEETKGVNPLGVPIQRESTKMSFDYRVKEFKSKSEELHIG